MPVVYVENVGAHEGNEITLNGWVCNRRSSGKLQFIMLREAIAFPRMLYRIYL
jgi:asparaginyl-tRNA synthetase